MDTSLRDQIARFNNKKSRLYLLIVSIILGALIGLSSLDISAREWRVILVMSAVVGLLGYVLNQLLIKYYPSEANRLKSLPFIVTIVTIVQALRSVDPSSSDYLKFFAVGVLASYAVYGAALLVVKWAAKIRPANP